MENEKGFKITRRSLDALRPADGSDRGTWHRDRETRGFYAIAYSSGEITFAVRYRVNGRRRMLTLGTYPATAPEDARNEALAIIGAAARGVDESETRKAARREAEESARRITFETWRADYVKDAAKRLKSTRDPERYLGMAGKEWDSRPLAEITTRDVETWRNRLAEKGATQANRALANLRSALAHAVRLGYIDANPAARVPLLRENAPRTRTLSEDEEKAFRAAVKKHADPFVRVAFTLLLDTGARRSEVLRARWEDFHDLDGVAPTWTIPSPKAGKPQAVPLLLETAAVVASTPRIDSGPWLLPGRNAEVRRVDLRKPWAALMKAAKLGDDVHVHDLRRTAGLRFTRSVGIFGASKLLRHADSRITEKVYAPLAPEDLRDFAEKAKVLSFAKRKKARRA